MAAKINIPEQRPPVEEQLRSDIQAGRKRMLDVDETALYLGLQPRTIYNQIAPKAKKRFPVRCKRIGGKVLFDIQDLDRYIDSM